MNAGDVLVSCFNFLGYGYHVAGELESKYLSIHITTCCFKSKNDIIIERIRTVF